MRRRSSRNKCCLARCRLENHYEKEETKIVDLLTFPHPGCGFPPPVWEPVGGTCHIKEFILELGPCPDGEYERRGETVWVHKTAKGDAECVSRREYLLSERNRGPATRSPGKCLSRRGAVVGNSTELKNVILFDKVQVPHYNYDNSKKATAPT